MIWDTAGQDKFRAITKNYYKGSNAIILIYDMTNLNSFKNTKGWITQIKQHIDDSIILLLGSKSDLTDQIKVKSEDAKKFAVENGLHFMESSAKLNVNVNESFMYLTNKLMAKNDSRKKAKSFNLKNTNSDKTKVADKKNCNC